MQNANKFKLGLFGMNCSGSFATTAPERWQAGWPENLEAARLADEAGLEFILPIARWMGYGGQTDRQGELRIIVLGGALAGLDGRARRVLDSPCSPCPSGLCRKVDRNGGSCRAGAVRHQHRIGLER